MRAITGLHGFEIVAQIKTAYGSPILSRNIQRESLNASCFAHSDRQTSALILRPLGYGNPLPLFPPSFPSHLSVETNMYCAIKQIHIHIYKNVQ